MLTVTPYDFQMAAIDKIKAAIRAGRRRPVLQAPTASGKTVMSAQINANALAKDKRVAFCAPALSLIDQTWRRFESCGIPSEAIGVLQAKHHREDLTKPVQVCSIQTVQSRGTFPNVDFVIVDECHEVHKTIVRWMEVCPETIFIGLSATPWTKGLGTHYNDLIVVETIPGLIRRGFLSPYVIYEPVVPDMSRVGDNGGDYRTGQASDVMQDEGLVANVVENWLEHGENRPTLCYAVDRAHAKKLELRFNAAGVPTGYIDAYTKPHNRDEVERRFHTGELPIVVNVGCLTKGVDWDVRCLILARPTKSDMIHVQIIGRGLRLGSTELFGPKRECRIFDHAGNCRRLGDPGDIVYDGLCEKKPNQPAQVERKRPVPMPAACASCDALRPSGVRVCPHCGHEHVHQRSIVEHEGKLAPRKGGTKPKYTRADKQRWYSGLIQVTIDRGYKAGFADVKYREKFGVWPRGLAREPGPVTVEISRWLKSRTIAWAKAKAKAEQGQQESGGEAA